MLDKLIQKYIYRILWNLSKSEVDVYLDQIAEFKEKYGDCDYKTMKKIIRSLDN